MVHKFLNLIFIKKSKLQLGYVKEYTFVLVFSTTYVFFLQSTRRCNKNANSYTKNFNYMTLKFEKSFQYTVQPTLICYENI